jgi:hypothetical protein
MSAHCSPTPPVGVIIAVAATVAFQIRWRQRRRREMLVSVLGRTSRQDVEEFRHFDYDLTHAISKVRRIRISQTYVLSILIPLL